MCQPTRTADYSPHNSDRRGLGIAGDIAELIADKHTTRDDVPIPIIGRGLLYELKRVEGTWLIYDIGSDIVQPTPPQQ